MPLEAGDFIPELNANNPLGADPKSEGDDHLRLVKRCVLGSFPGFVGNAATPKSVTLTEDQINDAALKSAAQTISGLWEFAASPSLANNIALIARNVQDTLDLDLIRLDSGNSFQIGDGGVTAELSAGTQFLVRINAGQSGRFVPQADGSLLLRDRTNVEKKAGFRNPTTNQQNGLYTLQQSDEGRVVRNSSGAANTYTVPQLESFTTITVVNDDTNSVVTLAAGSGVTMTALVGGTRVSAPITVDQDSVVQIYWVNATLVLVWGNGIS